MERLGLRVDQLSMKSTTSTDTRTRAAWWSGPIAQIIALLLPGCVLYGGYLCLQHKNTAMPSVAVGNEVREHSVDFTLPDVSNGKKVRLSSILAKKPVVISFWATWCKYCPGELSQMQILSKQYGERVQFLAIDPSDSPETIDVFARRRNMHLSVLSDTYGDIARNYGVTEFPTFVLIDRDGLIEYGHEGYDEKAISQIPVELNRLLKNGNKLYSSKRPELEPQN